MKRRNTDGGGALIEKIDNDRFTTRHLQYQVDVNRDDNDDRDDDRDDCDEDDDNRFCRGNGPSVRRLAIGRRFCYWFIGPSVGDFSIYLSLGILVHRSVGQWVGQPFIECVRMLDQSVGRRQKSFRKGRKNIGKGGSRDGMKGESSKGRQ